jgi:hypothetical protein
VIYEFQCVAEPVAVTPANLRFSIELRKFLLSAEGVMGQPWEYA